MRIAFIFNHDQVHQIAHVLPIAAALARTRPDLDLVLAVTSDQLAREIARLSVRLGTTLPIVQLRHRRTAARALVRALDGIAPLARVSIYREHLDFFAGLDALVVSEKTSLVLKHRYGLHRLPIIHTRHGAGDRAIGFNAESAAFDHVLVSGAKIRDRLITEAGVRPERISVVGYPKFDLPPSHYALPFQDPHRPVVLYNPHPAPHLSSWYRHGRAVLKHFAESDRFNLIFAPHTMLFQRPFSVSLERRRIAWVGSIPHAIRQASNIHIDLGSPALSDMSYTDLADVYLGDVSSQLYEFLRRPRPCLFLNSHRLAYRANPDFAGWQAGPVIDDTALLGAALDHTMKNFYRYEPAQRELFARTFDLTTEPSSDRAARAILRSLGQPMADPLAVAGPALVAS